MYLRRGVILSSEILRRTALIQGNVDLYFYTSHLVSITLTEDFVRSRALELTRALYVCKKRCHIEFGNCSKNSVDSR